MLNSQIHLIVSESLLAALGQLILARFNNASTVVTTPFWLLAAEENAEKESALAWHAKAAAPSGA